MPTNPIKERLRVYNRISSSLAYLTAALLDRPMERYIGLSEETADELADLLSRAQVKAAFLVQCGQRQMGGRS